MVQLLSLDDAHKIKPMRASVLQLMSIVQSNEPDLDEVVNAIKSDPVLTSRILGQANSPTFGCRQEIGSIEHALVILGLSAIADLSTLMATKEVMSSSSNHAKEREKLFHHSLGCGIVAKLVSARSDDIDPSEAFLAGILHDIGKLVYIEQESEINFRLGSPSNLDDLEKESEAFGVSHSQLSREYAMLMNLPEQVIDAIELHHKKEVDFPLGQVVSTANQLSHRWMNEVEVSESSEGTFQDETTDCCAEFAEFDDLKQAAILQYSCLSQTP